MNRLYLTLICLVIALQATLYGFVSAGGTILALLCLVSVEIRRPEPEPPRIQTNPLSTDH